MVESGQYFDIYLNLSLLTTGVFDGTFDIF